MCEVWVLRKLTIHMEHGAKCPKFAGCKGLTFSYILKYLDPYFICSVEHLFLLVISIPDAAVFVGEKSPSVFPTGTLCCMVLRKRRHGSRWRVTWCSSEPLPHYSIFFLDMMTEAAWNYGGDIHYHYMFNWLLMVVQISKNVACIGGFLEVVRSIFHQTSRKKPHSALREMLEFFGSLDTTMISLYMASWITNSRAC